MALDQLIRPEVVQKRLAVAKLMDDSYSKFIPYINNAEFPFWIIPEIQKLGINGF